MDISKVTSESVGPKWQKQNGVGNEQQGQRSFSQVFSTYLNDVNHQVLESEKLNAQLVTGQVNHLHEVTIASEKAMIALQLTTQVRDKAVEAYQEMMRMQL
ncbi:flagellar hook-basal body complex protein FliE [Ammoniphilus oxalaticus]|uniref:Flagellar hook-basal body complex protein FliE n=1 Tax=Ammoniphilus oxalaticus TaxID=66863 RepID=A0A419SJS6_9BACL|nr:flagellar hook-basal body complex protein FliE [Ammoniphilus oxalaticus]RKD24196.1 flagellar hook-basal body complex protein FliE [Ammoniphilus oxalaticus]